MSATRSLSRRLWYSTRTKPELLPYRAQARESQFLVFPPDSSVARNCNRSQTLEDLNKSEWQRSMLTQGTVVTSQVHARMHATMHAQQNLSENGFIPYVTDVSCAISQTMHVHLNLGLHREGSLQSPVLANIRRSLVKLAHHKQYR